MTFIGAAQVDVGAVRQTDSGPSAPDVHSGSAIRRARIGVQGTAFNDFAYQVEIDLAGTGGVASNVKDVSIQYNGFRPVAFTVGNIKPRTGMETSFSDRSNAQTYMESSMLSSMYTATGTRNIGVLASTGGAHWSGSLGWFGDDINNNGVAAPGEESHGLHGRLTWAPVATRTALLHFGVSGFDRKVATDAADTSQLRVRAQPESAIDGGRLIDTGNITLAENVRLIGLESAGFLGPVGFQGEWGQMDIDRTGRPDATFSGAYLGANWFLTGESRVYDPRTGVFTRFSPRVNADPKNGNWGAWEVAARWSTLDLNSDKNLFTGATLLGIRGGSETNYTLGLNWYWNPYFRMMLDYVHAEARNRTNTLPGIGADEGTTLDLIGLRFQQEW
jgi:phosphate-selective porin OprO/OprP